MGHGSLRTAACRGKVTGQSRGDGCATQRGLGSVLNSSALGGRVTHARNRARRHGRRSGPGGGPATARGSQPASRDGADLWSALLLVARLRGSGWPPSCPASPRPRARPVGRHAADQPQRSHRGRRSHGRDAPTARRSTPSRPTRTAAGRSTLPGPGEYVVTLDADDLPEGVTLSGERQPHGHGRTEGRRQPVNLGLEDGSRGAGRGGVRAVQLFVDGLRFGLLIAMCCRRPVADLRDDRADQLRARRAGHASAPSSPGTSTSRAASRSIPAALIAMVVGAAVGALNELGHLAAAAPPGHRAGRGAGRLDRALAAAAVPDPDRLRRSVRARTPTTSRSGRSTTACSP